MPMSKKAYAVLFIAGGAGLLLLATSSNASAKSTKPGALPKKDPAKDITVQPPGPSGVPDGTVPPVTVHTDDKGNVTGVTVEAEQPMITPPGTTQTAPPPGSNVTTIPGPPTGASPSPVPGITSQPPTPIAKEEIQTANDPNGTVMLARVMLARETTPGWKFDLMSEIKLWQETVKLKPDGKFGPKSLERMAEEVGVLPLVRYWSAPVYNRSSAVKAYGEMLTRVKAKLTSLLPMSEYHIAALDIGSGREKGQGLDKDPKPAATLEEIQAIFDKLDAKAAAAGKKVVS